MRWGGEEIRWCGVDLLWMGGVRFFVGDSWEGVVVVLVVGVGSKCFGVLIEGRKNEGLVVVWVNEGLFWV